MAAEEGVHSAALESLCRVCANLIGCRAVKRECASYITDLVNEFGVNPSTDNPEVHPLYFCNDCFRAVKRAKEMKKVDKTCICSTEVVQWQEHTTSCSTCFLYATQRKGGRPRKAAKNRGRPSSSSQRSSIKELRKHIENTGGESLQHLHPLHPSRFVAFAGLNSLVCSACSNVVNRPVELKCGHIACAPCLVNLPVFLLKCPSCHCQICNEDDVKTVSSTVKNLLLQLQVHCDNHQQGCREIVPLCGLRDHSSQCHSPYSRPAEDPKTEPGPLTPSKITAILQRPLDHPLSRDETKAMSHLVRASLQPSTGDTPAYVECPTGGQPLRLVHVPRPRKASNDSSARTVRARSSIMSQVREGLSGGKRGAKRQLIDELVTTDVKVREEILREAGITPSIPAGEGLAMKAELAIPWERLRVLRRWLKKWGIRMGSEREQRRLAQAITPWQVEAENTLFSFSRKEGGEEFRMAALAYVTDLEDLVVSILEENKRVERLTWHDGLIPANEIWLKVGGDKGGGSFKMSFQVANVLHPNSVHNTVVFCAYEAGDTASNLHIALDRYTDQIRNITDLQWGGLCFKIFMYGDMEFLFCMYGLSGCSGKHCCLWCVGTKQEMQEALATRGRLPARTLQHLRDYYGRFQAAGSDIKKAKFFFNVVRPHFWDIEPLQVCIPGLHISLGVFLRLYELLEQGAHELDILIGTTLGRDATQTTETGNLRDAYRKHIEVRRTITALTEEANEASDHADFLDSMSSWTFLSSECEDEDPETAAMREEARNSRRKAEELNARIAALVEDDTFASKEGPCVSGLDDALQKIGVKRQAYYSGTFVGNHVHKCCKEDNIRLLCQSLVDTTSALAPECTDDATITRDRFAKLFTLFAQCHNIYNKAQKLDDEEIQKLECDIKAFLEFYREEFPAASITPKLHALEDHVVPWIREWGCGLGFLSEQGAESIHANFNTLMTTYSNIRSPVERLRRVIREHHLKTAPTNVTAIPQKKRVKMS